MLDKNYNQNILNSDVIFEDFPHRAKNYLQQSLTDRQALSNREQDKWHAKQRQKYLLLITQKRILIKSFAN